MKKKSKTQFKQLKLFRKEGIVFGGNHQKGNPTKKRPFSKKCDVHLVLKSKYAVGERSFLRVHNRKDIKAIIERYAKRFYISIKRNINVGNHIHLLIHTPTPQMQRRFLRTTTAMIARHVMNAHKGSPSPVKQFWDARPFTRLVHWGRAYRAVICYLSLNSLEAIGFTKASAREYMGTFSTA